MANALPYYDLAAIQGMFASGNWDFVNDKAEQEFNRLEWTEEKMIGFVSCLSMIRKGNNGDFSKNFPNQSILNNSDVVNADAYKMEFDEESLMRGNTSDCCFYIKLAILNDTIGTYAGVVSFHLDTFK